MSYKGRGLGYETQAIIEAIHNTENCAEKYSMGLWTIERVGKTNIYKVYLNADPPAIVMTGAAVVTQVHIPFVHRWLRIHFYHTDAALAVSQNYLRISLRRELGTMFPANFIDDLFCEFEINAVLVTEKFGKGFEYEAGVYNLILTTTATDLMFPLFYIQKLEA
jgi:hypothetical protein